MLASRTRLKALSSPKALTSSRTYTPTQSRERDSNHFTMAMGWRRDGTPCQARSDQSVGRSNSPSNFSMNACTRRMAASFFSATRSVVWVWYLHLVERGGDASEVDLVLAVGHGRRHHAADHRHTATGGVGGCGTQKRQMKRERQKEPVWLMEGRRRWSLQSTPYREYRVATVENGSFLDKSSVCICLPTLSGQWLEVLGPSDLEEVRAQGQAVQQQRRRRVLTRHTPQWHLRTRGA